MNAKSIIKYATSILFFALLLCGYFVGRNPGAFQKSIAIQAKAIDFDELMLELQGQNDLDIKSLLESIPYKKEQIMVYEVEPEQKYYKTIVEGYGNCSNLTFGLGYYLSQKNLKYQIVHFLPPKGFLKGQGHTVMHTSYKLDGKVYLGIVDVLEGGLPKSGENSIGLHDLREGNLNNVSILALNNRKDSLTFYYSEFLNKSVIGVTTSKEIKEYHDFLKSIYISIGNTKLEKYIYDGLAIFVGKYPAVYVDFSDYDILFENNKGTKFLSICFLWFSRFFVLFSIFLITILAYTRIKKGIIG